MAALFLLFPGRWLVGELEWDSQPAARAESSPVEPAPRIEPAPQIEPAQIGLAQVDVTLLPEALRFEHFTSQDGLSQDTIFFIFQDRQGFLWLGTQDGLNRYDGYRFRIFRNDPADPESLSHNTVLCVQESPDGTLWFGTQGGGLNRYDPRSGVFTRYLHDPALPASLSNDTVTALYVDPSGRLWVGTLGGGINLLDPATGAFSHYRASAIGGTSAVDSTTAGGATTAVVPPLAVLQTRWVYPIAAARIR